MGTIGGTIAVRGRGGSIEPDRDPKSARAGFHCLDEAAIIRREHLVFAAPVKVHRPHMFAATPRVLPRLSPLRCALASVLCGSIVLSPLPVLAADGSLLTLRPEALQLAPAGALLLAPAPAAAPAPTGNVVGLMRFGGDVDAANSLRAQVQADLERAGYTVKGVALDVETAAGKVKCKGTADECIGKVADWLIKGAKGGTTYNFLAATPKIRSPCRCWTM